MKMPLNRRTSGQNRLGTFAGLPVHHVFIFRYQKIPWQTHHAYITPLLRSQSALKRQKAMQLERYEILSDLFLMPSTHLPSVLAF